MSLTELFGNANIIFHKTDETQSPGLSDYDIIKFQKFKIYLKEKCPKATCSNQSRSPKPFSLINH
jgi:hypothetical protein